MGKLTTDPPPDKFILLLKQRLEKNEAKNRMKKSVNLVRNRIVKKISGSGKGEPYTRYFECQKIQGTASRPFDPPATFMGELKNSITIDVSTEGKSVVGKIIASAPHAKHLEFGTRTMQPRPFMHNTMKESESDIRKIFKKGKFVRGGKK